MPRAEPSLLSDADHAKVAASSHGASTLVYADGFVHEQANPWSQGIFDDFAIGFMYSCCPCCYGMDAVERISEHLGGIDYMGCDHKNLFCWVCCSQFIIRAIRKRMRDEYNLTGGICTDCLLGDHCPGCALRQAEAHVIWMQINSRTRGAAVLHMSR